MPQSCSKIWHLSTLEHYDKVLTAFIIEPVSAKDSLAPRGYDLRSVGVISMLLHDYKYKCCYFAATFVKNGLSNIHRLLDEVKDETPFRHSPTRVRNQVLGVCGQQR